MTFHNWVKDEVIDGIVHSLGLQAWSCINPGCDYKGLICSKDPREVNGNEYDPEYPKFGWGGTSLYYGVRVPPNENECPHVPIVCVDAF